MRWRILSVLLATISAATVTFAQTSPAATDQCLACHLQLDGKLLDPAKQFADDIHAARGFTCASCHGGNSTTDDYEKAKSRSDGYRGAPKRSEIPQLCAKCHSDGILMRGYNPSLRTDQFAQYKTSVHGQQLAKGDTRVAVCSDCHSIHGIRPGSSPLSTTHPLKIPETCGRCHANAELMKPYKIPTAQLSEYQASLHFEMLKGGDLSAPTCATCHGNHGAAPPGVASVERVCGTCHLFQQQLFDQSPHKSPWEKQGIAACLTCHSNHEVKRTSDAMLSTGEKSLCVICHTEGDPGWKAASQMYSSLTDLDASLARAREILDRAEQKGMEVSEARVTLSAAHEQLIKARVDIHAMDTKRVAATTESGTKESVKAFQAGEQALAEFAFRRKGLAFSLVIIAFVVLSLWMYIREIERPRTS